MSIDYRKAPLPWFGGKAHAAPLVWSALGDVAHFIEPFAGSLAVLLRRPHEANRAYYSETVNDADGLLCNAWRAMQRDPDATADAASWPVCEADVMARHLACMAWAADGNLERLMADPDYYDARIAGYWLHGICAWIGSGWCAGEGPWIVGSDGRITKRSGGGGSKRQLPHLADDGMGVHRPQARERGVGRVAREDTPGDAKDEEQTDAGPGAFRKLPHLADNGRGVHRPQARERGVARQRPHLGNDGMGVHRPQARERGVGRVAREDTLSDAKDEGLSDPSSRSFASFAGEPDPALIIPDDLVFHPRVMPELSRWFQYLSARLRHVRIVNGDWKRVCTTGAMYTLPVRQGGEVAGVFLDPPYAAHTGRQMALYAEDSHDIADEVRAWCLKNGQDKRLRIVLAGFDTEHAELEAHGWRVSEWFESGYLRGGMGVQSANGHQQARERLWFSPHCLSAELSDLPLFASWEANGDE